MEKVELSVMMEEYERLGSELEKAGYRILHYERVSLPIRIICRLVQLFFTVAFWSIIVSVVLSQLHADVMNVKQLVLAVGMLPVLWVIFYGCADWYFRVMGNKLLPRENFLPVSEYFAKRKMRAEVKKLQLELGQLDEKEARLKLILEKFSKPAMIIESQLEGRTCLVKEAGKHPRFYAVVEREKVLTEVSQPGNEYDDLFIKLSYDMYDKNAYTEFLNDVELLLRCRRCVVEGEK